MTSTKLTRLTQNQVSALSTLWYSSYDGLRAGRPYEITPTTASFRGDGDDAWEWMEEQINNTPGMPSRGYPRQALRSIQRKLRKAADSRRNKAEKEITRQLAAYEPEMSNYTRQAQEHEIHTVATGGVSVTGAQTTDYLDCGEPPNDWGNRTPEHETEEA